MILAPEVAREMIRRLVEPTHRPRARLLRSARRSHRRHRRAARRPRRAGADRRAAAARSRPVRAPAPTASMLAGLAAAGAASITRLCRAGGADARRLSRGGARLGGRHLERGAKRPRVRRPGHHRGGAGAALPPGAGRGSARRPARPRSTRRCASVRFEIIKVFGFALDRHRAVVALSRRHHRAADPAPRRRRRARAHAARPATPSSPTSPSAATRSAISRGALREMTARAVAAHGRDRAFRRRCRARDQEPAHLAAERGRDRGARSTIRRSSAAAGAGARGHRPARPPDHRHLRRLAARCRAVPRRARAGRPIGRCSRRWSRSHAARRPAGARRASWLPTWPAAAGDLAVLGIEGRLVQVFRNLIANAVSFSPPGGVDPHRRAAPRATSSRSPSRMTGPGIPEGKLEAIFERFYSERPAGEKFGTHSGPRACRSRSRSSRPIAAPSVPRTGTAPTGRSSARASSSRLPRGSAEFARTACSLAATCRVQRT